MPFLNCKWTRILWLRNLNPFAAHLRIELQFNTSKLQVVSTVNDDEHNQTKDRANETESAIEVNIVVQFNKLYWKKSCHVAYFEGVEQDLLD